jgi:hypothetical protein
MWSCYRKNSALFVYEKSPTFCLCFIGNLQKIKFIRLHTKGEAEKSSDFIEKSLLFLLFIPTRYCSAFRLAQFCEDLPKAFYSLG